jgi:hypothetical protein
LPDTVKKAIYVDTDAFFISNPLLLWQQFDLLKPETAIAMPSHPNLGTPEWHNADRICSCVILFDLEKLRNMRLIDSEIYRQANDGIDAMSPPAFRSMFGEVDPRTGHFENIMLGDQSYWWSIITYKPELYEHLSYDWEISSCLVNTYNITLGDDLTTEDDELRTLQHTPGTPHEGKLVIPKLLHLYVSIRYRSLAYANVFDETVTVYPPTCTTTGQAGLTPPNPSTCTGALLSDITNTTSGSG